MGEYSPLETKTTSATPKGRDPVPGAARDALAGGASYAEGAAAREPVGGALLADPAARQRARAALRQLDMPTLDYARALGDWQRDEWNEFLKGTGGNGFIALTAPEWREVATEGLQLPSGLGALPGGGGSSALGDAAGNAAFASGIGAAGSAALAGVTKASAKPVGGLLAAAVAGFGGAGVPGIIVGALVNLLWSEVSRLLLGDKDAERMAMAASTRATDQAFAVAKQISGSSAATLSTWFGKRDGLLAAIDRPETASTELEAIIAWGAANAKALALPPPKRGDLATKLRTHWVRQHAGDAEGANAETLPGAYEDVKQLSPRAGHEATSQTRSPPAADPRRQVCVADRATIQWRRWSYSPD